jgi:hypothetical protein
MKEGKLFAARMRQRYEAPAWSLEGTHRMNRFLTALADAALPAALTFAAEPRQGRGRQACQPRTSSTPPPTRTTRSSPATASPCTTQQRQQEGGIVLLAAPLDDDAVARRQAARNLPGHQPRHAQLLPHAGGYYPQYLYYATQDKELKNFDIYVMVKQGPNAVFSAPTPVQTVCTADDEMNPWLASRRQAVVLQPQNQGGLARLRGRAART